MRLSFLFIVLLILSKPASAQKPALDTSIFRDWPKVGFAKISNDGKFVFYEVVHAAFNDIGWKETIIQSTENDWKKTFTTVTSDVSISNDGKRVFFILSDDSLAIIKVGTQDIKYVKGVTSYRLTNNYLLYMPKGQDGLLKVVDMTSDNEILLDQINSFELYGQLDALILNRKTKLTWYSLKKNKTIDIWEGQNAGGFKYNEESGNIAFVAGEPQDKSLWVYHAGDDHAQLIVNSQTAGIDSSLQISRVYGFSPDGSLVFFVAIPRKLPTLSKTVTSGAKVTIWSYSDVMLKSQEEVVGRRKPEYVYAVNIKSGKIIPVTARNEKLSFYNNGYALVWEYTGSGNWEEADWNPYSRQQMCLKAFGDTIKMRLPTENVRFSKKGKYLLYFNQGDYYTYDLKTGATVNITQKIPKGEFTGEYYFLSNWLEEDRSVILYARRDIWEIDPSGNRPPVNRTNGYGARNDIIFYPLEFDFKRGKKVVMSAYNLSNKENGFFVTEWGEQKDPEKIVMEDVVYYSPHPQMENGFDNKPLKAQKSGDWLVKKMSASSAPNYFITKDFKNYRPVSNTYPERRYNWLTTVLHKWKTFDGDSIMGILYKPEDFDSSKKYPVIFYYYEQFSENLHAYLDPEISIGPMNIPWFVSHGYIVFVPDIRYQPGETGHSAYNSVVSAAKYLAKESYIDTSRMGLQGHSFGGYETNYIVTQTDIFRAACSASGITDLISLAGGIGSLGQSMHFMVNKGQFRLNTKLWDDPKRFMENSPLFYLKNVTTPLLVMHTTNDKAVPFNQALELFNGLRQFRKKVWLLIYEGEDHVLDNLNNKMDYTMRMDEFFNYYLKDSEEPEWMKNNIQ